MEPLQTKITPPDEIIANMGVDSIAHFLKSESDSDRESIMIWALALYFGQDEALRVATRLREAK